MSKDRQQWDPKTSLHRFWILAVSLIITSGTAISPALPAMQRAFSNYPSTLVNMVATIQQIPAFIILLFSSQIAAKFGIKKVVGLGMLLMELAGIAPAILSNLWLVLLARIVFGIGIGMTNSLAITLINLYYEGDDQAQMLGERSAFEPIGICIINLLAGLLLNISWQTSFLAYAFILVVLAGFWKVVPEYHFSKKAKKANEAKPKLSWPIIWSSVFCGTLTIGMAIVNVLTPSVVVLNHMGDGTTAAFIITAYTLASMAMGFLFGTAFKALRRYVLLAGLGCMVIGTLLMNYATNLWVLTLAVAIIGFAYPLAGTYVFDTIDNRIPKSADGLANSILLVGCNVGTAFAPAIVSFLGAFSPLKGTNPGIGLYGLLILVMAVVILLAMLRPGKHENDGQSTKSGHSHQAA
ncbi:MFS transporter [Fructobacillus sp. M158]|uniref:MFS transporter n=1 Tax=Fructobacillus parabroussonetiae TaxID=2713174 RepID=UPI00200A46C0|nr:MFS transporter [Fructobacillus parabroussonetiae]MCK8617105.1 MFS transporter [Fructobacillus parabroussonetiae]